MQDFITKLDNSQFEIELLVDGNIFDEEVLLKAAYEFTNDAYMHFIKKGNDYIVQFKSKTDSKKIEDIAMTFEQELVYHRLRRDIEKKTGAMRQKIVDTALGYGLTLDEIQDDIYKISMIGSETYSEVVNKERSVEDIIGDIENDPEFMEDKDEIIAILKEIK